MIRQAAFEDAAAIAAVQVASWHAAYAGILPQEHIERRTVEVRAAQWNGRLQAGEEEVFVACVGFATGLASSEPVDGFDGEIGAIYVLPEAQGRGIGKQLLRTVAAALRAKGFRAAWLRVLSENHPARGFYEKCGAEVVCETEEDIDGFIYREHFYGWRDLSKL